MLVFRATLLGETPARRVAFGFCSPLLCYQWLGFVLSQFPYTRSWGESLNIHLMALLDYLVSGILRALPGLAVALSIFFIARGLSAFSRRVLRRMARPGTLK